MSNKALTNEDYCGAAEDLRCEVAALMAVAEVESDGGGYDDQGRIKVRFEGHKFREYTNRRFDRTHPHLSYPYKLQKGKPHGYAGFNEAFALDEEAALKASSFGKFQPLAVNYREADFNSVRAFVDFLRVSEKNQLIVFCRMVKFRQLDDELRRKDWAGFARNYNGSAYRDNNYDGKMRRAYERFKKLRINCNEFADLTEDEINLEIPTNYSASGDSSRSDAISAPMSDTGDAGELTGGKASDSNAAAQQVADNINNFNAGDAAPKPEEVLPGTTPTDDPIQASVAKQPSRIYTFIGAILGGITALKGFVADNQLLIAVGIVCVTILFLAMIFRGVILDWLRMQLLSDPKRYNVK